MDAMDSSERIITVYRSGFVPYFFYYGKEYEIDRIIYVYESFEKEIRSMFGIEATTQNRDLISLLIRERIKIYFSNNDKRSSTYKLY